MNKKIVDKKTDNNGNDQQKNRFLTIFICISLAIVLVFGGVFGTMVFLRDARAVVKYDGVIADEGAVIYLASRYKTMYLSSLVASGVEAYDSPLFWQKNSGDGKTYGELYNEGLKEYIASVIIANHIYDSYTSYSSEDKRRVAESVAEILNLKAEGSVAKFNELTEKFGFDFSDFEEASQLLYKAQMAQSVVYGADGSNLSSFPEECEKFLGEYSHVSLLFLREHTKIVKDENGVMEEVALTSEEKARRKEIATTLRNAIKAREEESSDGWITPEMFELFLKESDGDKEMYEKGYYFRAESETTAEFAGEFPEIVERALTMKKGEYAEVECSIGTCFIYRYEPKKGAYTDKDNLFFSDFYSDASDYLYRESLRELSVLVEFRDAYFALDTLSIPKNYEFYVKVWKK